MTSERKENYVVILHLKRWRIHKGMLQEELAEATDLTQATISRLENGGAARLATVKVLAEALGITREQLLHQQPEANLAA